MGLTSIANRCADLAFATKRLLLGRNRARRGRLYCVGLAKTGTHSIASMFSKTVRAKHEPQPLPLIERILAWRNGGLEEAKFVQWLRERDRKLGLEVDSSLLNWNLIEILVREFPDARFVLTIRNCYSWCNSLLNHNIRHGEKMHPLWKQMGHWRMRPEAYPHAPEEAVLKQMGFHSLDCLLSHWARHNAAVLEQVPPHRLLVVRTDQITERAFEIADFGGFPRRAVRLDGTHAFQNPAKQKILLQMDRDFVESRVEKHCRGLMSRFFPEIKSLADVKL